MKFAKCIQTLIFLQILGVGSLERAAKANLRMDLEVIAGTDKAGRRPGTPGHAAAQKYLIKRLTEMGLKGAVKSSTQPFLQKASHWLAENIVAYYPGLQNSTHPLITLMAHYDHLGNHNLGAADNGGGVAVVLKVAEKLIAEQSGPFLVVFTDYEEFGYRGAQSFLDGFLKARNHSYREISMDSCRAILNFDIIGLRFWEKLKDQHFIVGSETGGKSLEAIIDQNSNKAQSQLNVTKLSAAFGHERNDCSYFLENDIKIPCVLFSDGDGSVYHSRYDTITNFDFQKAERVADMALSVAKDCMSHPEPSSYVSPVSSNGYLLPNQKDADGLANLFEMAISNELLDAEGENYYKNLRSVARFGFKSPSQMFMLAEAAQYLTAKSRQDFVDSQSKSISPNKEN